MIRRVFKAGAAPLLILLLTACSSPQRQPEASPAPRAATTFRHGVNVSHYLSQLSGRPYADPAAGGEADLAWIRAQGYDHIRLPVDGPLLIEEDGTVHEERFAAIDQVLLWARRYNLGVQLDLHKLHGSSFAMRPDRRLFSDPQLQALAVKLWVAIARRYRVTGPELRYEILNEPVAETDAQLTAFYAKVITAVRAIDPGRVIVLCSNRWGSFRTVQSLEPLLTDRNLVVGVHYYEPHIFTHQGASWVGLADPDLPAIPFPGIVPDLRGHVAPEHYAYTLGGAPLTEESIAEDFGAVAAWAAKLGVRLHLGEFGVYRRADAASRERWYRAVLEQCRTHDIDWAVWDYEGAFAVRDPHSGRPTIVQQVISGFLD